MFSPIGPRALGVSFGYSAPYSVRIIARGMERAVYRILDANFNRAREAARVVEEYCRFALNSQLLTDRAKRLRHRLCGAIARLDAGWLIAGRDTAGDVGAARKVEGQLARGRLEDCLTAGCKRLTEALRAMAEVVQAGDAALAEELEALRFEAYAMEKDIMLFAEPVQRFKGVRLYVIITSDLPVGILSLARKCAAGGADCIQLRAKDMSDDRLFAIAAEFVGICREAGVLSIINDRVDIAVAAVADGVHLGQEDLPVAQARWLQARPMIIGKSTHSLEQLRSACGELVTYAAVGPVFPTATKPGAGAVGLEYVAAAAKELAGGGIASVAVGGIGPENVEQVLRAGARAIAVCSAVTGSADPKAACKALKEKIAGFNEKVG